MIIDEYIFDPRTRHPGFMVDQIRHLLDLADSAHATVRVIPREAPVWEQRLHNFDVLSFAGTADRIGVAYSVVGASLAPGDKVHDLWTLIADNSAADQPQSRSILQRHLTELT